MSQGAHPTNHHDNVADDADVHEGAKIQVDFLSHKWQEADVWHTWRNMTRQKNDIANGVRLENASWRTWWQKRGKLKTVNPQKLNWLKDSDVTWLYGPLHQAPVPVPPPKIASLADKLDILPPLPKGRKPILKKRTLAEVLVLGLAKTNNLPNRPPADELKELDIDSRGVQGPEERDRIMLLHTKSDTNLLRPAIGRAPQPSPPSDDDTAVPRRSARRPANNRSSFSNSTKASVSPPPHDPENGPKKRVGFNTFVSQCIAVTPGEQTSSEDGDEMSDDALSMKSGGSSSHGKPSTSRSNSHSSSKSDHLIIAPMAPTLLKANRTEDEQSDGPALIYMPIDSPFDKDSDEEYGFGSVTEKKATSTQVHASSDAPNGGAADLGGDYNVSSKKRKLSTGEVPPSRRQYKGPEGDTGVNVAASKEDVPTSSSVTPEAVTAPIVADDTRGRTLHRVSSGSSLNERSRSRNGNSPLGSESPESSRASSSNTRVSSSNGLGVTRTDLKNGKGSSGSIAEDMDNVVANAGPNGSSQTSANSEPESSSQPPAGARAPARQDSLVDKAVANARGLIGTLLNGQSSSSHGKRGSI